MINKAIDKPEYSSLWVYLRLLATGPLGEPGSRSLIPMDGGKERVIRAGRNVEDLRELETLGIGGIEDY